ncbi:MAG TPA: response regulator, partial [Flavitalea sp.]|nr:response regulator [Flavitalea sp.]
MKAIAIDDEPIALEIIKAHAAKVPFLELKAEFTDAFKALEYLQKENIDLLFLDIKMPDISGIDFFNSLARKPLVIFTTAYSEHAVTSFELDAVDYLLKPFSLPRFIKSCNKAFELFNFRNGAS